MRVERKMAFASLEGSLMKHGVPLDGASGRALKTLQASSGNITALQIAQIQTLIEKIILARDHGNKQRIIRAVSETEL